MFNPQNPINPRAFQQLQQQVQQHQKILIELEQKRQQQEQERIASAHADAQIKVLSAAFDKSIAYVNFIILGGYAGFFGLWQLTKDSISKQQSLFAALFALISLVLFISFELYKMVVSYRSMIKQSKVFHSNECRSNPQLLLDEINKLQSVQERSTPKFMFIWAITFFTAVLFAFTGAGILGYAFVCGLLKQPSSLLLLAN